MSLSQVGKLSVVGVLAVLCGAAQVFAADQQDNMRHDQAGLHGHGPIGSVQSKKIVGATVQNANGDKIGSIEDLVIDTENNKVVYAALGVGGVLGMGEKLYAIPMEQLKFSRDSSDNPVLVLDITKERLEKAPGFEKNHWPDFGKSDYRNQVNDYYRHQ